MKKKIYRLVIVLLLFSVFISLFFNFINLQSEIRGKILVFKTLPLSIVDEFKSTFPNKYIELEDKRILEYFLNEKDVEAVLAYDVQAIPIFETNKNLYWYPIKEALPVISVDRNITKEIISGWEDLRNISTHYSMTSILPDVGLLLSSISYGIHGLEEDFSEEIRNISSQYKSKKFSFDNEAAPVKVLFDYQVMENMEQGENLEVIFPKEGALTFEIGILSKIPLENLLSSTTENKLEETLSKEEALHKLKRAFRNSSFDEEVLGRKKLTSQEIDKLNMELFLSQSHINRNVYGVHHFTKRNTVEHNMAVLSYMIIIVLWLLFVRHRTIQKSILRLVYLIGGSMLALVMVRFIKWQLPIDSTLTRYLWYSYYVTYMLISSSFLWLATSVGNVDDDGKPPKWWWKLLSLQGLFIILVYTNDLHQLIFIFSPNIKNWANGHSYGIVFAMVYAMYVVPTLVSMVILYIKSWNGPRKVHIFTTLLIYIVMLSYWMLYIFRIAQINNSDIIIVSCTFIMILGESAMSSGLIPRNIKYKELFNFTAMDIQIINQENRVVFESINSTKINEENMDKIKNGTLPMSFETDFDHIIFAKEITGGMVVWQEEIGQIKELEENILCAKERQEETNRLLEIEQEVKSNLESIRAQEKIYEKLQEEIRNFLEEIQSLAENITDETRQQTLEEIYLISIYVKRRFFLILRSEEDDLSGDSMLNVISELLETAELVGIKNAFIFTFKEEISTSTALILYDFIFIVLRYLTAKEQGLILRFYKEEEKLILTAIGDLGWKNIKFPESWKNQLKNINGSISYKKLDEAESLTVVIPVITMERGNSND